LFNVSGTAKVPTLVHFFWSVVVNAEIRRRKAGKGNSSWHAFAKRLCEAVPEFVSFEKEETHAGNRAPIQTAPVSALETAPFRFV
jgi:hypothetical protein